MYLGKPTLLGNAHTSRGVVQSGQEVGVIGVPQGALGNGRGKRKRNKHWTREEDSTPRQNTCA